MISIVVLAAGESTRFDGNKLLERVDGSTLIEKVVRSALSSMADEVVVVLGYQAEKLRDVLRGLECRFVINEGYKDGQSSSVKKGVESVIPQSEAVIILPGDIVLITAHTIDIVIGEYNSSRMPIVVAAHKGRLGHPVLLDHSLYGEILEINEATRGLKAILEDHKDQIRAVETGSDEVLIDVDTREDLQRRVLKRIHKDSTS